MDKPAPSYPKRETHFAHRYCRLLTKSCASQEIGHVAFVLCVTIAHLEDAKRYNGPVTFFNEQLLPLIAVTKWESLDRARQRAAQAGWLYYEPGKRGQRMPGRYWVTIPDHLALLDDKPCDESQYPPKGEREESLYPPKGEREGEREGEHSTLTLSSSCPKLRFEQADRDTAEWMLSLIRALDPKCKQPNLDKWANEIRLMRERDKRTDREIRATFTWANRDSFWRSNVLSPTKLRDKFSTLSVKANSNGQPVKKPEPLKYRA